MGTTSSSSKKGTGTSVSDMFSTTSKQEPRTGKKETAMKLESASKTGVLSLTGHHLEKAPPSIFEIEKMSTLDLSSNLISALPADIQNLKMLKTLKLDHNKLQHLPTELGTLPKLANFSAAGNLLRPGSLACMPAPPTCRLIKLVVPQNKLGSSAFGDCARLEALQVLDLSANGIDVVSEAIGSLIALLELTLDDNAIDSLPDSISNCLKLKVLSLRRNRVHGDMIPSTGYQSLPESLFVSTQLERLNLEGNPIERRQLNEFKGVNAWMERCSKTKQKDLALYMG